MWKIIVSSLILSFTVNVTPQLSQIAQFLNNVTVSDITNVLRWLPISNPISFDGQAIDPNDVLFYLYTRRNPQDPDVLKPSSTTFNNLNPYKEVKFIVHGWLEDANRPYVRGLIEAYLRRGEYNVIGVSWATLAGKKITVAARNTRTSGRALGDFIIHLNNVTGILLKQVHILGHSLGAHLAGFAGKRIQERTGKNVGRITALDAAGPFFEIPFPVEKNDRLDRDDADFVDCIHTDGGVFGMIEGICHVDFYPNGGVPRQPGCSMINTRELSSRVIINDLFCSHNMGREFYRESINSDGFISSHCNSYENYKAGLCKGRAKVQMGENCPASTRGKFYLETNAAEPYSKSKRTKNKTMKLPHLRIFYP